MYPAGILTNTKTGRFHPIVFRRSPLPSEGARDETVAQRHKSIGHHTDGFDTIEEAEKHLADHPEVEDKGARWAWDGECMPALVHWF